MAAFFVLGGALIYFSAGRNPSWSESKPEQANGLADAGIEIVAEGLNIPWEIAFLPSGEMLVTERTGTLKKIGEQATSFHVEGARSEGEGGLLGLAIHPDFEKTRWLYLYLTAEEGGGTTNRVERYSFDGNSLSGRTPILGGIPGASIHDGGRIAFGPDGNLYITTGDAGRGALAQDKRALAGKILRVRDDGSIPDDNPFGNAVWSYGHRNPQGLGWDSGGRLWATEHGRSGVLSGLDELNLIEKGQNYGWPEIQGGETRQGMQAPAAHSGSLETWAPAGAVYLEGNIVFAGLRGESLYVARVSEDGGIDAISPHFRGQFGRLRALAMGPDGFLYVSTSNRDGRGRIRQGDDKIMRINPRLLFAEDR